MAHLETQPQPSARANPSNLKKKIGIFWGCLLCMTLVGGYAFTNWFPATPTDSVSQQETEQRLRDFTSLSSLQAVPVAKESELESLEKLGLQAKDRELMRQTLQEPRNQDTSNSSISSGRVQHSSDTLRLIELTLWDTHSEDGDIVHVSSEGYERDVMLKKTPTMVTLPCRDMSRVKITGIRDGGGGITLGVKGQQTVLMPIMRPGQSLELPMNISK